GRLPHSVTVRHTTAYDRACRCHERSAREPRDPPANLCRVLSRGVPGHPPVSGRQRPPRSRSHSASHVADRLRVRALRLNGASDRREQAALLSRAPNVAGRYGARFVAFWALAHVLPADLTVSEKDPRGEARDRALDHSPQRFP